MTEKILIDARSKWFNWKLIKVTKAPPKEVKE